MPAKLRENQGGLLLLSEKTPDNLAALEEPAVAGQLIPHCTPGECQVWVVVVHPWHWTGPRGQKAPNWILPKGEPLPSLSPDPQDVLLSSKTEGSASSWCCQCLHLLDGDRDSAGVTSSAGHEARTPCLTQVLKALGLKTSLS